MASLSKVATTGTDATIHNTSTTSGTNGISTPNITSNEPTPEETENQDVIDNPPIEPEQTDEQSNIDKNLIDVISKLKDNIDSYQVEQTEPQPQDETTEEQSEPQQDIKLDDKQQKEHDLRNELNQKNLSKSQKIQAARALFDPTRDYSDSQDEMKLLTKKQIDQLKNYYNSFVKPFQTGLTNQSLAPLENNVSQLFDPKKSYSKDDIEKLSQPQQQLLKNYQATYKNFIKQNPKTSNGFVSKKDASDILKQLRSNQPHDDVASNDESTPEQPQPQNDITQDDIDPKYKNKFQSAYDNYIKKLMTKGEKVIPSKPPVKLNAKDAKINADMLFFNDIIKKLTIKKQETDPEFKQVFKNNKLYKDHNFNDVNDFYQNLKKSGEFNLNKEYPKTLSILDQDDPDWNQILNLDS